MDIGISVMSQNSHEINYILDVVQALDHQTKRFLLHQIQAMLTKENPAETWTEDELAVLIDPHPLSGAEIIAAGLTGTWADGDIQDGAEWVNVQKAERQHKTQW